MPPLSALASLLVCLLVLSATAHAKTIHVNHTSANLTNCSLALSTSSPIVPIKTINEGIRCLAGGDTLLIASGTYDEVISNHATPVTVPLPSGLSTSQPTRVQAMPNATVLLRATAQYPGGGGLVSIFPDATHTANHLRFSGINVDAAGVHSHGILFSGDDNWYEDAEIQGSRDMGSGVLSGGGVGRVFRNLNVHDNALFQPPNPDDQRGHGMYVCGTDVLIEHNRVHHNNQRGIQVSCEGGKIKRVTVRYNHVHDNGVVGITMQGAESWVHDNVLINNGIGIQVDGAGGLVFNNTIIRRKFSPGQDNFGIHILLNTTVKNNLILDQRKERIGAWSWYIWVNPGINPVLSNNLCDYAAPGCALVEPDLSKLVVNAVANNLQLVTGSKAINAGTTPPLIAPDYAQVSRPQGAAWDIGAYEYVVPGELPPIYHVSPAGLDGPPPLGTRTCLEARDSSKPLRTINQGIACLGAGQTVNISAGTYNEALSNIATAVTKPIPSGTQAKPTLIQALPGAMVIVKPTGAIPLTEPGVVTLDAVSGVLPHDIALVGVHLDASNLLTFGAVLNGNGLSLEGASPSLPSEVKNAVGGAGITSQTGTGLTLRYLDVRHNVSSEAAGPAEGVVLCGTGKMIEKSVVHHNTSDGIKAECVGGLLRDITIRYNTVYDNAKTGIYVNGHDSHLVYDNLLLRNAVGIATGTGAGAHIFHNSLNGFSAAAQNYGIWLQAPAHVFNNLLIQQSKVTLGSWSRYLFANAGVTPTLEKNLCDFAAGGCEIVATNLAALVVNAATDDLRLPAGSPASNAGVTPDPAQIFPDIEQVTRPIGASHDIGAYESVAVPSINVDCVMSGPVLVNISQCTPTLCPATGTQTCKLTYHNSPITLPQGSGTPCVPPGPYPAVTTPNGPVACDYDVDCVLSQPVRTAVVCPPTCPPEATYTCTETWTKSIATPPQGDGAACGPLVSTNPSVESCTPGITCVRQ